MMRATLLTPAGRGAVATIRIQASGGRQPPVPVLAETASSASVRLIEEISTATSSAGTGGLRPPLALANGEPLERQPVNRVAFGRWGAAPGEEVVVCRVSETAFEIHCHGGTAAVTKILSDLEASGATVVPWQTWMTETLGSFAAELADALAKAPTERCARILLSQSATQLARIFAEGAAATPDLQERAELLRWAEFGRHLTEPWQVVLTGRPNVGKSSLVNALVGYGRAIVSDQPGTTRDVVTAETAFDGWPVRLCDTAGIREAGTVLEQAGIARAAESLYSADLRLVVLDASEPLQTDDHKILAKWPAALVVINKCDLPNAWDLALKPEAVRVSSRTGEALPKLIDRIAKKLVPVVPPDGTAIPFTERQVRWIETADRAAIQASGASYDPGGA